MGHRSKPKSGMADPTQLAPQDGDSLHDLQVIIETPKGSRNKYAFDPEQKIFQLKKVLMLEWPFLMILDSFPQLRLRMAIPLMSWC
jgi:hypothetical protein